MSFPYDVIRSLNNNSFFMGAGGGGGALSRTGHIPISSWFRTSPELAISLVLVREYRLVAPKP